MSTEPFIIEGVLGWGNTGCNSSAQLDTYGPGGRWARRGDEPDAPAYGGRNGDGGDQLADALVRAGGTEGTQLVVVALPRFCGIDRDRLVAVIEAELAAEVSPQ